MSSLLLVPLLALQGSTVDWQAQWQQCRNEPAPLVRLACYDTLGLRQEQSSDPGRAEAWREIQQLESAREGQSAPFMLTERGETLTLTRPALRGATLSIACASSITRIRVRLDIPWQGEVQGEVDGKPASASWFVRDGGYLLEFGRGLPAIDELKRWSAGRELILRGEGAQLRVDLTGLGAALAPLRQQCRW
ncbi:type VI secretion system-associated protein VasI [Aeromonas schubertii]